MILLLSVVLASVHSFPTVSPLLPSIDGSRDRHRILLLSDSSTSSWDDLQEQFSTNLAAPFPVSIDTVLHPLEPSSFSTVRPTLFRERHGWCPYSERVWLALEMFNIDYDTIRIDNTGGPRPSYYTGGQTPQILWPETTRRQGESMDLIREIDQRYCHGALQSDASLVQNTIAQFQTIFPRARPSSRAAFLFQNNGEPLWRRTFEQTLQATDALLASTTSGPFFCGDTITAADLAWVPFLERYRYQLPCLHPGLTPDDPTEYPHLSAWYTAMETQIPAYVCRIQGDASSWRKVLTMAGYGNAGVPPDIEHSIQELQRAEARAAEEESRNHANQKLSLWKEYQSTRPHVADTPAAEAAGIMYRNRDAIVQDIVQKRSSALTKRKTFLPDSLDSESIDRALRQLIQVLLRLDEQEQVLDEQMISSVGWLAAFLDERMCVPRDMGAMSAACIKGIARYQQRI